jgi:hypothetical protein
MTDPSDTHSLKVPILAGIAYFALVLALEFLLGTARIFFVREFCCRTPETENGLAAHHC